jgi:hypothetical protein
MGKDQRHQCVTIEAVQILVQVKKAKAIAVSPQELYDVATASAEHEDVSGERLQLKYGLHLRTAPPSAGCSFAAASCAS